jgi:5-methyltetrahydropteroyltriglutamate--homocysteine methyltransferase
VQIDDPLLTYFLSPKLRAEIVAEGDEPDRRFARYLELLNQCIAARRPETTIAIHLCRGNARSEWMAEGAYDAIAEQCFGTLAVDRYLLEFDDARSGSFEPLRFLPKDKHVVLGLITTKTPQLEDKDAVNRRIDDATRFVPLDRLAISPQCGFASVVEGNKITPADQRAKLALVTAVAREVWGGGLTWACEDSASSRDMQADTRALLQIADHAEEVLCLRIAARPKHADQAFGRRAGRFAELLETDSRLDVITQDRLARLHIAAQHGIDALAQKRLGKFLVALDLALDQFLKALCSPHFSLPSTPPALALLVVLPIGVRRVDVALLPILGPAGQKDHQSIAVLPEINPVSRSEV